MSRTVWVVHTGTANVASVDAALRRAGVTPVTVESTAQVDDADFLVLPGVGAFGAAAQSLRDQGMIEALQRRIRAGRPTLAICLGLQLLAESSEETPDVAGLGIVPGTITRFSGVPRVPQFGWSPVAAPSEEGLLLSGYAYFANSYCMRDIPDGWDVALSEYGGPYVAAMAKDGVLACQFHPELSSDYGQTLIQRWLEG